MFWLRAILLIHFAPQIFTISCLAAGVYCFYRFAKWYIAELDRKAEERAEHEQAMIYEAAMQHSAYLRGDPYGMYGGYEPYTMPTGSRPDWSGVIIPREYQ